MPSEDQYMERTPDLVAKIRAMRVAAEKGMNRFTRVDDYDVRRVVGHEPQAAPVSNETVAPSPMPKRAKKATAKSATDQASMEFPPAPAERGDDGEDV
jgi:hypothetical protein